MQRLPAGFPAPILITQHVAAHSPGMLPTLLSQAGPLHAAHARHAEILEPGRIHVAPPDRHMLVKRGYISLSHGPQENHARPAIDPLFRSAAAAYGPAVVGVVLTGQLDDGTAGLLAIKDRGGTTIVQDPKEATAPSMPMSAIENVPVDHRCRLAQMATLFVDLANDAPSGISLPESRKLLQVENRIADGIFDIADWWVLERMSIPSGLNCPNCRSALYELKDRRVLRFRCRSGHAFSALSLLSGQADAREAQLSSMFGTLTEEATLAKRMLRTGQYRRDRKLSQILSSRLSSLQKESGHVADWLHAMIGLVEPEPRRALGRRRSAAAAARTRGKKKTPDA